jgi:GT2 family glycosyltransferase
VTPSWFGVIVRALLAAGHRTVVTGQVRPGEPEGPGASFAPSTKSSETPMVYEGRIGKDVLYVQNMALFRSALDEIGGFDPRLGPGTPFPSAEDNDFAFRLLEAGYRILYVPAAVTYHRAWRSRRDMLHVAWGYGLGQGAYYAKHLSPSDLHMLKRLLLTIANHLLRLPLRLWRQRDRAYDSAAFVAGLLAGASRWLVRHT